jgi:transposase
MSAETSPVLGIDVSKEWIDARMLPGEQSWKVSTLPDQLQLWIDRLPRGITLAVMEASGGLEMPIAAALSNAGIPVAIVNPKQIRAFATAMGKRAKTDALDAQVIARFGDLLRPAPRPLPSEIRALLNELVTRRRQLIETGVAEQNRLSSMRSIQTRQSIEAHLRWLKVQVKEIEKQLEELIKKSPTWMVNSKLLTSVPGVGPITSCIMLAALPELGKLSHREISSLVGLAPVPRESGKWRGKRFIRGGRADVRSAMYMCILSAIRYNPIINVFYIHLLAAGKDKKVAMVACMHKLLIILNAIIRDRKSWNLIPIPS